MGGKSRINSAASPGASKPLKLGYGLGTEIARFVAVHSFQGDQGTPATTLGFIHTFRAQDTCVEMYGRT